MNFEEPVMEVTLLSTEYKIYTSGVNQQNETDIVGRIPTL